MQVINYVQLKHKLLALQWADGGGIDLGLGRQICENTLFVIWRIIFTQDITIQTHLSIVLLVSFSSSDVMWTDSIHIRNTQSADANELNNLT